MKQRYVNEDNYSFGSRNCLTRLPPLLQTKLLLPAEKSASFAFTSLLTIPPELPK